MLGGGQLLTMKRASRFWPHHEAGVDLSSRARRKSPDRKNLFLCLFWLWVISLFRLAPFSL